MKYNYLTNTGMTFAEAEALLAKANAYVKAKTNDLQSISFVDSFVTGEDGKKYQTQRGANQDVLSAVGQLMANLAEAKALIDWLNASLGEKNEAEIYIDSLSEFVEDYCMASGDKQPVREVAEPAVGRAACLADFDVKLRCRYYQAQARSSVYGKFIHPNGAFATARDTFYEKQSLPIVMKGEGQNALVYTYTPTVNGSDIDNAYFELQNGHREAQAEFNSFCEQVNVAMHNDEQRFVNEGSEKESAYNRALDDFNKRRSAFQTRLANELNNMRVTVPTPFNRIVGLLG